MKRKSLIAPVALLVFAILSLTGCHKYEQIRVISGELESVAMNGFKSIDVSLSVMVDNPAGKVVVQTAEGTLKHFGKVIGKVSLAPLTLAPRSLSEYKVQAHVELADGLGLKQLLMFADPARLEECVADISIAGKAAGVAVKRNINDVPLKKLLENAKNEKI